MVRRRRSTIGRGPARNRRSQPQPRHGLWISPAARLRNSAIRTNCGRRGFSPAMRVSMGRRRDTPALPNWLKARCATCGPDQTADGAGWIEFLDQGLLIRVRGKTGWREVEIGRGSSDPTCPVVALQTWLKLGRIAHGPLFRRIAGGGKEAGSDRLTDRHVARLVKRTALAAGVRGDLSEAERRQKFSGHSLRAGLATAAQVDERYVQRQLGHASAEMTRRYQRQRDRFRVNLTKAAGL